MELTPPSVPEPLPVANCAAPLRNTEPMITRTVHLHVGAGKTGTSAIQVALVRNREWLAANGVDYPEADSDTAAAAHKITSGNGLQLAKALNPDLANLPHLAPDTILDAVMRRIAASSQPIVLYSSEIMGSMLPHRIRDFRKMLSKEGLGLHMHVWVRNVAGHALSKYNQLAKRHRYVETFSTYVRTEYKPPFMPIIKKASDAAGRANVLVTSYDENRDQLFGAFCRTIGIAATGFEEVKATVNRSLSRGEIAVMQLLSPLTDGEAHAVQLSDALIYSAPERTTRHCITPEELAVLRDRFASDVENVNAFCGREILHVEAEDVRIVSSDQFEPREIDLALIALLGSQEARIRKLETRLRQLTRAGAGGKPG